MSMTDRNADVFCTVYTCDALCVGNDVDDEKRTLQRIFEILVVHIPQARERFTAKELKMTVHSHTEEYSKLQQACSSNDCFQTFDALLEDACNAAVYSGSSLGVLAPAGSPAASEVATSTPLVGNYHADFDIDSSPILNRVEYARGLERPTSMNKNAGIKTRGLAAGSSRNQPLSPDSPTIIAVTNETAPILSSRSADSDGVTASKSALSVPFLSTQATVEVAAAAVLTRTTSVPVVAASNSMQPRAPSESRKRSHADEPESFDDDAVADFLSVGCWNDLALPGQGPARDDALDKASQALGLGLNDHQVRSWANSALRCANIKYQTEEASSFAHSSSNCVATAFVKLGAQP